MLSNCELNDVFTKLLPDFNCVSVTKHRNIEVIFYAEFSLENQENGRWLSYSEDISHLEHEYDAKHALAHIAAMFRKKRADAISTEELDHVCRSA